MTRTLGELEANGCAMLACGVESATGIHPSRKRWWLDTTVGAPNVETHAPNRVGEEASMRLFEDRLARAFSMMINILDPDVIVV